MIVVDRKGALDTLEILVEVLPEFFTDEMKKMKTFQEQIAMKIFSVLGISAKITLVEPKTIELSMGKAKRVVDKRKLTT